MVPETRVFQAANGKDLVILACTIFDSSTRVTDRRTNRIAMAKMRVKVLQLTYTPHLPLKLSP